ncbi:MAG: TAXI family TRAP transporter solute-binding subunit [Aliidongia sp.]
MVMPSPLHSPIGSNRAMIGRRGLLCGMLGGMAAMGTARTVIASPAPSGPRFFRIGTGATSGTYFPIGSEIAGAISNPPGSRDCARGGSCGVPGLIAVAQATQGSVENVELVVKGQLESAMCQGDVAGWAYFGTNLFEKMGPTPTLCALASLYSETLHIVIRADSPIRTLKDLKGRRVALGEPESGTLVDARLVLNAIGLSEKDVKGNNVKLATAEDGLRDGMTDAVFQIAGYPVSAIGELASTLPIRLLSIPPEVIDKLKRKYRFFTENTIPAGTYDGIDTEATTLGIGAEWIATTALDADFVYEMVKALWNDSTRHILDGGHPIGKRILRANALDGLALPLHAGAERFYREVGLLPSAVPG